MSEPIFYSKNWVDSQSVFSISHAGTQYYAYDRNASTQLVSIGANSDATLWTMQVYFYENGAPQNRAIDTVFFKNHNFKNWNLYKWTGSAWSSVASNATDTSTNRITNLTQFTANAMQLTVQSTQTANQEKAIGELIYCSTALNVGSDMASYDPKWRERSKEITLGDGSLHKVYMKDASGRLGRYEASVKFNYLSKSTRDSLKAIKDAGQPFLWHPESVTVPEEVYLVHWANAWDEKYMSSNKSAGYEVALNLKEV